MAPSGDVLHVCLCCVCVHRSICLTGSHISETERITMLHVLRLFNKRTHHLCDQNKLNCAQRTGCIWLLKEFDISIRRSLSSDHFNGSSMPFSHESIQLMQVLMCKGLPLCPLMIRDLIVGLHLSLPLYFSLSVLPVFVRQVLFPGFSRKEALLEGEFAIYFQRQKHEMHYVCVFFPPSFCPLSICIFVACSIVESLHPTQASVPSVCPRGERTGRARLD